jgi:APA family basic amino acid/polyamine antiporter
MTNNHSFENKTGQAPKGTQACSGLFVRKSMELLLQESEAKAGEGSLLPRTLGLFSLTCLGVSCTIGAGIFVLTGTVAAEHAGPAVTVSFILASVACLLAGLCYAEFAALVPVVGSAYSYAYVTLGEIVAWVIGWCLILEYLFASSLIAIGWAGYVTSIFADWGMPLPAVIAQAPLDVVDGKFVTTGAVLNLPAVIVTLVCTCLLMLGTQLSARINNVIAIVNILCILVIGIAGLAFAHPANWLPFVPPNAGRFGEFGVSGIITGAATVFYAYVGFDAVSTMSQETRNPERTVPLALIAALAICSALYVLIALMVTGLIDYRALAVPDPLYRALAAGGSALSWVKTLAGIVIGVGLIASLLVTLLGQVRIFFAMGRDGLLPPAFAAIHPRWRTPHLGTIVTGLMAAAIAAVVPLKLLGELISIGTLLAFAIVCLGIMVLRSTRPDMPRPFRVPAYPWVPLGGIAVCLALMASLPADTWIRLIVWLALGFAFYCVYGFRFSALRRRSPSSGARDPEPGA